MNKLIAFYLPQFHPTPNNNLWWGDGFTEWTNVAKAKRLFPGHYQPRVPADLGFYDLRLSETREAQAEMAKEYGIYGFCYYHYWFEAGKEELQRPFDEVVVAGKPDFPFCLCWANESWYSKFWNKDGSVLSKKLLVEQKYLGKEDNEKHFYRLLPAFKDHRYIKHEGKLLFVIYKPLEFNKVTEFIEQWQKLAVDNGLPGFYFVGLSITIDKDYDKIINLGFDGVQHCEVHRGFLTKSWLKRRFIQFVRIFIHMPLIINYKKASLLLSEYDKYDNVFPSLIPNWDHTPRSGYKGSVYINATPEVFEKQVKLITELMNNKQNKDNLCFLKSWNEWGEGNYVEPDLKYGKGFLEVIKKYFKYTIDKA